MELSEGNVMEHVDTLGKPVVGETHWSADLAVQRDFVAARVHKAYG